MPTTINGTGITFPNGTTQTTAASGAGTVTSVATGNGLSGGTITTSGTLVVACPSFNSVGSYTIARIQSNSFTLTSGSNYSAGGSGFYAVTFFNFAPVELDVSNNLSGTWKYMGGTISNLPYPSGLACRVS